LHELCLETTSCVELARVDMAWTACAAGGRCSKVARHFEKAQGIADHPWTTVENSTSPALFHPEMSGDEIVTPPADTDGLAGDPAIWGFRPRPLVEDCKDVKSKKTKENEHASMFNDKRTEK